MGVGAAMFGGGRQEAQEVEQRPCDGAKSSEGMTFHTGFGKSLMAIIYSIAELNPSRACHPDWTPRFSSDVAKVSVHR